VPTAAAPQFDGKLATHVSVLDQFLRSLVMKSDVYHIFGVAPGVPVWARRLVMVQISDLSTAEEFERLLPAYRDEDVILFEEGLIGFPSAKRFVLIESESLSPFRILKCVDNPRVGFLVLDPRAVIKTYERSIPIEAWTSLEVTDKSDRLSLVISIIGKDPQDSTANLQAPLLINHRKMLGKQLILTNARYSVTQRLVPSQRRLASRHASSVS
jgi:flagellar assembly factor FliW